MLALSTLAVIVIINLYSSCAPFGRGNSLRDAFSESYTQIFHSHHGWALRKAVSARIHHIPTKQQLHRRVNEDGKYSDKVCMHNCCNFRSLYTLLLFLPLSFLSTNVLGLTIFCSYEIYVSSLSFFLF